jgi:hypothetical protein
LRPSVGRNPVETQNDKYTPKTYTFDVTKCDEIFDFLVADGQGGVPNGLKIPPLEQHKKRCFCKYHNFLGHKTSHCVLFRDWLQRALNEGMLKFGDKTKPQMQVDVDPLKDVDAMYSEVASCNVVEAIVNDVEKDVIKTIGDEPKEKMGSQKLDYVFNIYEEVVSGCMISRWRLQESIEIEGKWVLTKCLSTKWLIPKLVKGNIFDNRTFNTNSEYLGKHKPVLKTGKTMRE